MKVAILSESPADQAAILILAKAVLRRELEPVTLAFRPNGWSSVLTALEIQIKHLHYRSDAEGMIVMLDSDDTPVHTQEHQASPKMTCRCCQVMDIWRQATATLTAMPGRAPMRIAVAIPVPAIEAWFRCGHDPHAEEAPFVRQIEAGRRLGNDRRALKRAVYGVENPKLTLETDTAIREATRLAGDLDRLRTRFPLGFGTFYETLATWR
jgi:hypothetical protein